jgi:cytochrome d ubiquinol oxidase subunit I
MLLASGLTVSFLIAGLSALRWYLAGDRSPNRCGRRCAPASSPRPVLIPLQIFVGDQHGLNTLEHQPQKIAAMEGQLGDQPNVPLVLFAWPDEAARRTISRSPFPTAPAGSSRHQPRAWCPA